MATPNVENTTAGIQNKNAVSALFPIRLAANSNANKTTARTQNMGDDMPRTVITPGYIN